MKAPAEQALGVFTAVVVIVCLGSVVVTIQAKVRNPVFLLVHPVPSLSAFFFPLSNASTPLTPLFPS